MFFRCATTEGVPKDAHKHGTTNTAHTYTACTNSHAVGIAVCSRVCFVRFCYLCSGVCECALVLGVVFVLRAFVPVGLCMCLCVGCFFACFYVSMCVWLCVCRVRCCLAGFVMTLECMRVCVQSLLFCFQSYMLLCVIHAITEAYFSRRILTRMGVRPSSRAGGYAQVCVHVWLCACVSTAALQNGMRS